MPPQSLITILVLALLCFGTVRTSRKHKHKNHTHLCNFTEWVLKEKEHITKNFSGPLRTGPGDTRVVNTEVDIETGEPTYINTSQIVEDCCVGFEKRGTDNRCTPCNDGKYGRNCSEVCYCDGCRKCNKKTGKCRKCDDPTSTLTTTTTLAPSTYSDINSPTSKNNKDDIAPLVCRIFRRFKSCTTSDTKRCQRNNKKRTGGQNESRDSTIILTAVISLLGTITVLLAIRFILRESKVFCLEGTPRLSRTCIPGNSNGDVKKKLPM